ncbi:XRE family transcriptional regulator [Kibdelosporangium persicum]|uniref:ESX-1 secreted protein regulator EspR n=1 Tax=Kibdelosporangium persicum TaxID=2698649 RepID=A0ABX2F714_9PSEU|nr:XRE family transcriptional regulator [Kibdelosporangium persicum]NRN66944.1 ESX-1 secreted protein regulator EspR [Kibdelosporangium persicum]
MTHDSEPQPGSLSEQLNRLFEVLRPAHSPERTYTNREVVTACRAEGWELSESHLSELRRGVKQNPTLRTLKAVAWFFDVPVGYFTDPAVTAQVERDLADREQRLRRQLAESREAQDELRNAARELQEALRASGVTKTARRDAAGDARTAREQASMMRALARALVEDDDEE